MSTFKLPEMIAPSVPRIPRRSCSAVLLLQSFRFPATQQNLLGRAVLMRCEVPLPRLEACSLQRLRAPDIEDELLSRVSVPDLVKQSEVELNLELKVCVFILSPHFPSLS